MLTATLLTIGEEILIGQIVDTNSAYIGKQFTQLGITITQIISIPDEKEAIISALNDAEKKSDIVLMTGGLGPTKDDITKKTLADYFQVPLVQDEKVLQHITSFYEKRVKRKMNRLNEDQALIPKGALALHNEMGTAPGMWMEHNQTLFISLPGVPFEMKYLMEYQVVPNIKKHFQLPYIEHEHLLVINIPESELSLLLEDWENELPPQTSVAYLPSGKRIRIRLTAKDAVQQTAQIHLQKAKERLLPLIQPYLLSEKGESVEQIIGEILTQNHWTLATAESFTGGAIAQAITSVSGSSTYFKGSVVSYATEVKKQLLGVTDKTLQEHTVVSEETAIEMAQGIQKLLDVDVAISSTGVAGPTKGEDGKEVGLAYLAIAIQENISVKKMYFPYMERNEFIALGVKIGLNELLEKLKD